MLINIDRYEPSTKTWVANGHLKLSAACNIYSTQHNIEYIEFQLNTFGVYRTQTTYEWWEWDKDFGEYFLVTSTYPIRFTVL